MTLHFISQPNLGPHSPKHNLMFLKHLAQHMGKIQALYVLDGLFEVWTGDENRHHATEELIAALAIFTQQTPVFVQTGFGDFLLGETFAKRTGITLLPPIATIKHHRQTVCLLSSTTLIAWHPLYQAMRERVMQESSCAVSPFEQEQRAQRILKTIALNQTLHTPSDLQTMLKEHGMDFASNPNIIHGHIDDTLDISTFWRDKPSIQHGLPHWHRENGTYTILADGNQNPILVNNLP